MSAESEAEKYARMWNHAAYRRHSPGEKLVEKAISEMGMVSGRVIDFGCGTGRATQNFMRRGFDVLGIDHVENCLDPGVKIPFLKANLWSIEDVKGDYGFCCDVMEHIPPEYVNRVLEKICEAVPHVFFDIAFTPDTFGKVIGEPLHLTVKPAMWWHNVLNTHWKFVKNTGGGTFVCKTGV